MKHLKKFNESSTSISKQDILDICLDLTDIGFLVEISSATIRPKNKGHVEATSISINKTNSFQIDSDIIDALLRISDYVGDRLYNICLRIGYCNYTTSCQPHWRMYYRDSSDIEYWRDNISKEYKTYTLDKLPELIGTNGEYLVIFIEGKLQ